MRIWIQDPENVHTDPDPGKINYCNLFKNLMLPYFHFFSRRTTSISSRSRMTRRLRTRINCIFIFKISFLFTFIRSGNFQFYFRAFHLLDPDPRGLRLCGSETLFNNFLTSVAIYVERKTTIAQCTHV